jgi:putative membrane protein
MSRLALFLAALGLALAGVIVHRIGIPAIAAVLGAAGGGIMIFVAAHGVALLADALAWARLIPRERRPGILAVMRIRWTGEAVNNLLPVRLGGDLVRAVLVSRRGLGADEAGASVVVDVTLGLAGQIVFGALALILLVSIRPGQPHFAAFVGLVMLAAVAGVAIAAERFGWLGRAVAALSRSGIGRGYIERLGRRFLADGAGRLDSAVRALYGRQRALYACLLLRLVSAMAGAGEVFIGASVLGHPVSPAGAVIVSGLAVLGRSAAFGVPAGLGVQEGSFVLLGGMVGLSAEAALALAMMWRIRELAFGLPALVAWAVPGARGRAEPQPPVA